MPDLIKELKLLAVKQKIAFKRHAALRMYQRNITTTDIEDILANGEIIENYSNSQPLPCYLILGYTRVNRPLHVVVAIDLDDQLLWAITVYEPNLLVWEKGFRDRRK